MNDNQRLTAMAQPLPAKNSIRTSTYAYAHAYDSAVQFLKKACRKALFISGLFLLGTQAMAQTTWTGAIDSDWNDNGNWTAGIPTATDDVVIPNVATSDPVLTAAAECRSLTINVGGDLTGGDFSSSYPLTVHGNWTNNGTFQYNNPLNGNPRVIFAGSDPAIIGGIAITTFHHLTTQKDPGITVTVSSATVNIGGDFTLTSGTFNAAGNLIVAGNFILNGGIFNAGSSTIEVKGNFTDNGATFVANTSSIILSGTLSGQLLTDDPLYKVSINKSGGAIVSPNRLDGLPIIINNDLTIDTAPLGTTGGLSFINNNNEVNVLGALSVVSGQITLTAHDNIKLTVAGSTTISGGSINVTRADPQVAVTLNGGLTMTAGGITVGQNATFRVTGNTSISNIGLLTTTTVTPVEFNGNVALVNAGTRFASNASVIVVNGNWTSAAIGNFTYTNSLVRFEGNTNVTITGSTQFSRLQINKNSNTLVNNSSSPFTIASTLEIKGGVLVLSAASNSMSVRGNLIIESGASLDMGNPGVNVYLGGGLDDQNSVEPSNVAPNRRGLYINGGDGSLPGYAPISPAIVDRPTLIFDGDSGDQVIKGAVQLRDFTNSLLAGRFGLALPNVIINKADDTLRFNSATSTRIHGNLTIESGGLNVGTGNALYFGDQSSDEILINTQGTLMFPAGSMLRMNTGSSPDGSFLKVNGGKLRMIGSSSQPVNVNRDGQSGSYYRMAALSGSVEAIYTTFNFQGASNNGFPNDPVLGSVGVINGTNGGFKIYSPAVIDPDNKGYNFSFCVLGANAAVETTSLTINNDQTLNIFGTIFNTSGSGGKNCVNNTDPATSTGTITFLSSSGELGGVFGENNDAAANDAAVIWLTNTFMYWVGNYAPAGFRGTDPVTSVDETHVGNANAWSNPKNWTLGGGLDADFLPIPPSTYLNPYQVFPGQMTGIPAAFDPDGAGPETTPVDTLQKFEVFISASAPTNPTIDGNYVIQGTVINNSTGGGNRLDISPIVTGNYGSTLSINGYKLEVYGDFVNNSRRADNSNMNNGGQEGVINTSVLGSHIVFRSNFASFHPESDLVTGNDFILEAIGSSSLQEIKVRGNDLQELLINKPDGRVVAQGFGADRLDIRGNLTINSGGFEMLTETPLLVNGNFAINTGSFKSNNSKVTVRGNWNNQAGTVDFASGTINFYPATTADKTIRTNGQAFNVVNFGMVSSTGSPTPTTNSPFTGSTASPGLTKYTLLDNFAATSLTTVAARGEISGSTYTDNGSQPAQARTIETAANITVTLAGLRIRENGSFTAGQGVTVLNANNTTPYGGTSINPFPASLSPIGILVEAGATTASNGRLNVLGWPNNYAKVSRDPSKVTASVPSQSYRFRVQGTISARYYLIEYMDGRGIDLDYVTSVVARPLAPLDLKKSDPLLPGTDPANVLAINDLGAGLSSNPYAGSFSDGILTNGVIVATSSYIRFQDLAATFSTTPDTVFNASFPVPFPIGGANIRRTGVIASCPGTPPNVLWFRDATGAFAGEDFDVDGTGCGIDPIQWKSRPLRRWDGNGIASNTAWHDPLNWSPDGVPQPNEDVILDRTLLDASYTVLINSATTPLGVPVKVNSLRIDNSNTPINPTNTEIAGVSKIITLRLTGNRSITLSGSYTAVTPSGLENTAVLEVITPGSIVEVGGNWSNRGTYIPGSSKVVLGAGFTGSRVILNFPEPNLTVANNAFYNLEMATGRTELNSALKVLNNLTVTTPVASPVKTKFDASLGNQPIFVSGNWINRGRFLPQQGMVTFFGATAQTITQADTVENFYGLTIDKASDDVTLNSRTVVSRRLGQIPSPLYGQQPGGLLLANGRFISTAGKEMIVDLNTPIQRVGSPAITSAYVKGPLGRVFSGTGSNSAEYVIGDTQYPGSPVTLRINALTNTDPAFGTVFIVEQIDKDPDIGTGPADPTYPDRVIPQPLNIISKKRYWNVKNIMFPDTKPTANLNADQVSGNIELPLAPEFLTIDTTTTDGYVDVNTTLLAAIAQVSQLSIIQDSANAAPLTQNLKGTAPDKGTHWGDLGGILDVKTTPGFPPTIVSENFNLLGNGDFTFGWNYLPLPIDLLRFNAEVIETQVQVTWITASEQNVSHFVVQRSMDGKTFESIGRLVAAGNSNSLRTYAFTDKNPHSGKSYYRLQSIDLNETAAYSKVVSVRLGERNSVTTLSVYPNPFNGRAFNIQIDANEAVIIKLHDAIGRLVYTEQVSTVSGKETPITTGALLPPGMYILQVITANGIYQRKLLVK